MARLPSGEPNISGDWAAEQLVMTDPAGRDGTLVPLSRVGTFERGAVPEGQREIAGARGTPEAQTPRTAPPGGGGGGFGGRPAVALTAAGHGGGGSAAAALARRALVRAGQHRLRLGWRARQSHLAGRRARSRSNTAEPA